MECVLASIGFKELCAYLGATDVADHVYHTIKEVTTDVTHAYNNGKKIVDITTGYINRGRQSIFSEKKQLRNIKRRANKVQIAV